MSILKFEEGEVILQEGETGTWLGLLLTGALEVELNGASVKRINPGLFIGEMILWSGGVRQATVKATRDGYISTMLMSELHEMSLVNPQVRT